MMAAKTLSQPEATQADAPVTQQVSADVELGPAAGTR